MNVAFNASTIQKKYHYLTIERDSWLSKKKKKKEHDSCFLQIGWNKRNYIYNIYIYIYILIIFSHCVSLSFIFHYSSGTLWLPYSPPNYLTRMSLFI